ncbi:MAG: glutamate racemase [Myxococcaceae bacterium]
MSDNRSIGVFDSGLGGLTVLSAITQKFPNESILYLGDTARLPYGTKSPETVIKYALSNAEALMSKAELKLLVVACNTATAHALPTLAAQLPIPVIGVIEPGALEVAKNPQIKSVAVLATAGTTQSKAYEIALRKHGFEGEIFSLACPLFVSLVEEGLVTGPIAELTVKHYLSQLPHEPDAVILGCTHYPLLLPTLRKALPAKTIWVDSGSATASHLEFEPCDKPGSVRYFVTDTPKRFQELSSLFLGKPVLATQLEQVL